MTTLGATWLEHPAGEIPDSIEGLIFDCDGTLIDTMPTHFVAWTRTLQPLGIAFPEEKFYSFAGAPTVKIIESLAREQNKSLHAESLAKQKENYFLEYLPNVSPIEVVVSLARRERHRRKLSVASGGTSDIVGKMLEATGLRELFPIMVCSDHVPHGKPAPDIFLEAARQMGVQPSRCAVYEDGEQGFLAAKAAHMPIIDVRPWYVPKR